MIEFEHLINSSEVNANYLNLTDDYGNRYGSQMGEHSQIFTIIDSKGRRTSMKRHHGNQFTKCSEWFAKNNIKANTKILVRYDPLKSIGGNRVVYLLDVNEELQLLAEDEVQEKEIPTTTLKAETEFDSIIPVSLEKQIEDYIVANLPSIFPDLKIYIDENERDGRQYPTDIGIIDLLCVKPDGSYLVIELKRGKTNDSTVGQISRYMGWVMKEIAENKEVEGIIMCSSPDPSLQYAVYSNPKISVKYFRMRLEFFDEEK